jgi:hypothetical protein
MTLIVVIICFVGATVHRVILHCCIVDINRKLDKLLDRKEGGE